MNLNLEWLLSPTFSSLEFSLSLSSIILSLVYILLTLWALWRYRSDFKRLSRRKWTAFAVAVVFLVPAHALLVLQRSVSMLAAPATILFSAPPVPLLGTLLVAAIAAWLGPALGLVASLVAGLSWTLFYQIAFNDIFIFLAWGLTIGVLLHQPFKGTLFGALRLPIIALPLASLMPVVLLVINWLVEALPRGGLVAVDYALALIRYELPLWLVAGILHGLIIQALFLIPHLRPKQRSDVVAAYSRSLRIRFMIVIIPLILLSIVLSVLAVTSRAVRLAREQSLAEMRRSAANASASIQHFYYTGLNLLGTFAEDPALLDLDPARRTRALEVDGQVVAFFQELLLTDAAGQVITAVPAGEVGDELTAEEEIAVAQALDMEFSQLTHLTSLPSGAYGLTVVQPVVTDELSLPQGVLLGRVELDVNPEMRRAFDSLQYAKEQGVGEALGGEQVRGQSPEQAVEAGYGFIVDDRNLIVAHPEEEFILRPWEVTPNAPHYPVKGDVDTSQAYEDIAPEGERVLIYVREVIGTPYTVVIQLPFTTVLETATAISGPLLWVQLSFGLLLLFAIPFLSTQITKPLNTLAEAANQISRGNLDIPVNIHGEDEVAQLGNSFEQMRLRLKARLNDLSLLLGISQTVSATLDLEQGVLPILEGALEETGAVAAHFVMLSAERPQRVFAVGQDASDFTELDQAFAAVLARRKDPLVIQDLLQSQGPAPTAPGLRSVAVFPVRTQNRIVAVLWVGADLPDAFDEARVNFLSTLASQAAVLVDNARLFQAAEGGRRRLAAILASTTDAILVTDHNGRLLLINPAAQRVLGLNEAAYGALVQDLDIPEPLAEALGRSEIDPHVSSTVEISLPDGRIFYASVAPIMAGEGLSIGHVAVMRDVTHFKELDEMKSEFVATVSHDLRAPLTFIRGYTTMLMMVGELNDKQHEYLERILEGIDQMSALIGDLLNLRRIEAGVGVRQEPCRLGLILVEAVDTMRARATAKGIALRLEPAEGAPTVIGDRTLLRQAVSNLVDNAVKYTPSGGQVSVGLDIGDQETIIRISDTGIGVSPEDQIRLFEKFYRIKRRETSEVSGTGLGLALVKSIVDRHGGRVWMESELNRGSTFYIALPLSDTDSTDH